VAPKTPPLLAHTKAAGGWLKLAASAASILLPSPSSPTQAVCLPTYLHANAAPHISSGQTHVNGLKNISICSFPWFTCGRESPAYIRLLLLCFPISSLKRKSDSSHTSFIHLTESQNTQLRGYRHARNGDIRKYVSYVLLTPKQTLPKICIPYANHPASESLKSSRYLG